MAKWPESSFEEKIETSDNLNKEAIGDGKSNPEEIANLAEYPEEKTYQRASDLRDKITQEASDYYSSNPFNDDRINDLLGLLSQSSDLNRFTKWKLNFIESDWSDTIIAVKPKFEWSVFNTKTEKKYLWDEISFKLINLKDFDIESIKMFDIVISSNWELSVNWNKVANEKAWEFLGKIEQNLKEFKEYRTKIEEERKEEERKKENAEKQEQLEKADKMLEEMDF